MCFYFSYYTDQIEQFWETWVKLHNIEMIEAQHALNYSSRHFWIGGNF